jgi:hypothetical protein
MTGQLENEIGRVHERASILADETRRKVTGTLEDEIRKAREQASIFAEETRVIRESTNKRGRAASERLRDANERLQRLLQEKPSAR